MIVSRQCYQPFFPFYRGSQDETHFNVPRPRTSLIDGLGTSRRKSLYISFTLHIYYNIFFLKNQICYICLVSRRNFFDIRRSNQLNYSRISGAGGRTRTYDLRQDKQSFNCCYRLFMEKVMYGERKGTVHFSFFTLHIYYNIFFFKSQKELLT